MKPQPTEDTGWVGVEGCGYWPANESGDPVKCRYGVPGDGLWVREATIITPKYWSDDNTWTHRDDDGDKRWVQYLATSPNCDAAKGYKLKIKPSIHMPRWASRISLQVDAIDVQKPQGISKADAIAEGIEPILHGWRNYSNRKDEPDWLADPRESFHSLIDSVNPKHGSVWAANPWMWAITFHRIPQEVA